ncbi:MAG: 50S ribosomal protein L15 [Rhizobiales bacterium]|nr:50S ribosomal protein L15 [Hyphomicrobiales bacterium]
MKLNEINDNAGATTDRKRVGRGVGSGTGRTSARGHKGQKSRSGVAIKGFEGGQMPLHRRLPKRGFHNLFSKNYNEINLGQVQKFIDAKKLDAKKPVTLEALMEGGFIKKKLDGVRLLGNGELTGKVSFEVAGASKAAIAAVEKVGGTVTILEAPKELGDGKRAKRKKEAMAKREARNQD